MKKLILMITSFCLIGHSSLIGQNYIKTENLKWNEITLNEKYWEFEDSFEIITPNNNPSIKIEGKAVSKIKLEGNFSVEIRFKDASWPAIFFNRNDSASYEEVYLRIFRSGMPEAIQYIPVLKGFAPWRIYGFEQAVAEYNPGWNTLRVDVVNGSAYIFINNEKDPSLTVKQLRHDTEGGYVGFGTLYRSATISYFKYAKIDSEIKINLQKDKGIISEWKVSQAFSLSSQEAVNIGKSLEKFIYPREKKLNTVLWEDIKTEYDGILNISKYRENKDSKGNANYIYAKSIISTEAEKTVKLTFGYCDFAVIYLNGEFVYSGFIPLKNKNDFLRAKMDNQIQLNLIPGENELLIISSGYDNRKEDGGWGIFAKIK
jgi:hypothetical protein